MFEDGQITAYLNTDEKILSKKILDQKKKKKKPEKKHREKGKINSLGVMTLALHVVHPGNIYSP